jgi:hypothetical protein
MMVTAAASDPRLRGLVVEAIVLDIDDEVTRRRALSRSRRSARPSTGIPAQDGPCFFVAANHRKDVVEARLG